MQRTPYWLIENGVLIDLLAIPAMGIFLFGVYRIWKKISAGRVRFRPAWSDIRALLARLDWKHALKNGVAGAKVYREPVTGLFHGMVFWGMLVLAAGTTLVLLNVVFGLPFLSGAVYRWFMAFGLDLAGLAALVGVAFLMGRRLLGHHRLAQPKSRSGFVTAEILLLAVLATGFGVEALRIGVAGTGETAFVGAAVAQSLGLGPQGQGIYITLWWVHGLLALGLIAYLPYSPLVHILLIPANAAAAEAVMGADSRPLDDALLEPDAQGNMPALGTPTLGECDLKQRFDFAACLWCGRCQEVCPAAQTEKSLTPKGVMLTLAEQWQATGNGADSNTNIVDAVGMETLFECRTCGACVEACPTLANPLKTIWRMRQHLMMERGEMPGHMLSAYRNMEALMHPFSTSASPSDWRQGLEVPRFKAGETEYLLWIGCAVAYEDRAQQIGRAMVTLLNAAGVSYGIIEQARCTGDPAKQMGDDYLFAMLANANIDLFRTYGVKKIITLCPHCYNAFNTYYPPLGGDYEVIPHARMIEMLIASGAIELENSGQAIAYHDPCYLGRHSKVFDAPRQVVAAVGRLAELPRHGGNSFCCGAGGGNYWNEENGQRINYARAREVFDSGAQALAAACPFCLLMLTDGMKMFTDTPMVHDIAELVAAQLTDHHKQNPAARKQARDLQEREHAETVSNPNPEETAL